MLTKGGACRFFRFFRQEGVIRTCFRDADFSQSFGKNPYNILILSRILTSPCQKSSIPKIRRTPKPEFSALSALISLAYECMLLFLFGFEPLKPLALGLGDSQIRRRNSIVGSQLRTLRHSCSNARNLSRILTSCHGRSYR